MSEPHVLLTGLQLGESPRWHGDRLWLSDWAAHHVLAVDPDGSSEVMVEVPAFPFCIDWLPDGRLLVVSGSDGRLLRREPDGSLVTHADLTGISGHRWNDIVVDGRGNAYVNNVGFDFPGGEFAPGVIAMVTPDGAARQVADGIAFPNGMAVTPDNSTLIVAESYAGRLTAFDIGADGGLSNRRVWADNLGPDGICLDADGAVWTQAADTRTHTGRPDSAEGACVRVAEGGTVLQRIEHDRAIFAAMLGGPDRRTLFMMAAEWRGTEEVESAIAAQTGQVLVVDAPAPSAGWP
jgi:sugar lactone lactonase YvrE